MLSEASTWILMGNCTLRSSTKGLTLSALNWTLKILRYCLIIWTKMVAASWILKSSAKLTRTPLKTSRLMLKQLRLRIKKFRLLASRRNRRSSQWDISILCSFNRSQTFTSLLRAWYLRTRMIKSLWMMLIDLLIRNLLREGEEFNTYQPIIAIPTPMGSKSKC